MTDSLRDRIAEALFDACCRYEVPDTERYDMADAVIAALGLRQEHDFGTTYPEVPVTDCRLRRWVTDWEADQ